MTFCQNLANIKCFLKRDVYGDLHTFSNCLQNVACLRHKIINYIFLHLIHVNRVVLSVNYQLVITPEETVHVKQAKREVVDIMVRGIEGELDDRLDGKMFSNTLLDDDGEVGSLPMFLLTPS